MTARYAPHPKDVLTERGMRAKHSFGQCFLTDESKLGRIADLAVGVARDDAKTVVELGPGLGALTRPLLDRGARVHAVERDRELVPILREQLVDDVDAGRLTVHEANALTFPFDEVKGQAIAGNLPYHHAADLALRAVDATSMIGGAVFLIQLEVAERLAAKIGTKAYGALTVLVGHRMDVDLPVRVKAGAFWPPPDVDGGVVRLLPREEPRGGDVEDRQLKGVVRCAFHKRRKTVRNALKHIDDVDGALDDAGVDPKARAEDLEVERFVALARAFAARGTRVLLPGERAPSDA